MLHWLHIELRSGLHVFKLIFTTLLLSLFQPLCFSSISQTLCDYFYLRAFSCLEHSSHIFISPCLLLFRPHLKCPYFGDALSGHSTKRSSSLISLSIGTCFVLFIASITI